MVDRKGGPKDAAKMLAGLDLSEREKVIDQITKEDPSLAELLRQLMVTIEDLKHLNQQSAVELFKEFSIQELSLALRVASDEVKEHIKSIVSRSMKEEIEHILDGAPRPKQEVMEAHDKIMEIVRQKVEQGTLILKPDTEEYV